MGKFRQCGELSLCRPHERFESRGLEQCHNPLLLGPGQRSALPRLHSFDTGLHPAYHVDLSQFACCHDLHGLQDRHDLHDLSDEALPSVPEEVLELSGDASSLSLVEVEQLMLGLQGNTAQKLQFCSDFGRVRHSAPDSPILGLSECGDERCGAHRLKQPQVRNRFRSFVVQAMREAQQTGSQWWSLEEGLRYVSLGSGLLLSDLELLERLRAEGVKIAEICLIDKLYGSPRTPEANFALQRFADWQAAVAELPCEAGPTSGRSAKVVAFSSAAAFRDARRAGGANSPQYVDLLMHCDASWEGCEQECMQLAMEFLAPGGLLARLSNLGSCSVSPERISQGPAVLREFWRNRQEHSDAPFSAEAWCMTEGRFLEEVEDPLLGEDSLGKQKREAQSASQLRHAEQQRARALGLELWRVIHPQVAVMAKPSQEAHVIGKVSLGDELVASRRKGNWIRLAGAADLWDVQYSSIPGREESLAAAVDAWVLIHDPSFHPEDCAGRFLQQSYKPPGREAWLPVSQAESARYSLHVDAGGVELKLQGIDETGNGLLWGPSWASWPAATRQQQRERSRWRGFVVELQELSGEDRRKQLAALSHEDRGSLKAWARKDEFRWTALASELSGSLHRRQQRLTQLSVEERICFRQWMQDKQNTKV